ncbi:phosphatase PAP2 family protein [Pontibacillus yanchengensis]|nr:phosphatase PAP2 family protein [Pontibacillus yanchengensis]
MNQINRKKLTLIFTCLLTIGFTITLTVFVDRGGQFPFDLWSAESLYEVGGNTWIHSIFIYITKLVSRTVIIVLSLLIVSFLLMKRDWLAAIMMSLGVYFGNELNEVIKGIVKRHRPSSLESLHEAGYSFPSGHAMVAVIFYSLAAYFLARYFKSNVIRQYLFFSAYIIVLLIGISRYILSAHYLTDVIGGFLFGILFVNVWIVLHRVVSNFSFLSPPRDRDKNIL